MICPKCGKQIPENTKFCPYCGNDLTQQAFGVQIPPAGSSAGPQTFGTIPMTPGTSGKKSKKGLIIGIVCGAVALLAAAAAVFFIFFNKPGNTHDSPSTETKETAKYNTNDSSPEPALNKDYKKIVNTVEKALGNFFVDLDGDGADDVFDIDSLSGHWFDSQLDEGLGYAYEDLDGNGNAELLIGKETNGSFEIFDLYSTVNGKIEHLLSSSFGESCTLNSEKHVVCVRGEDGSEDVTEYAVKDGTLELVNEIEKDDGADMYLIRSPQGDTRIEKKEYDAKRKSIVTHLKIKVIQFETASPETGRPETKVPETKAPETKEPETEPQVKTMSAEEAREYAERNVNKYLVYLTIGTVCDYEGISTGDKFYSAGIKTQYNNVVKIKCCKNKNDANAHLLQYFDKSMCVASSPDYYEYGGDLYLDLKPTDIGGFCDAELTANDIDAIRVSLKRMLGYEIIATGEATLTNNGKNYVLTSLTLNDYTPPKPETSAPALEMETSAPVWNPAPPEPKKCPYASLDEMRPPVVAYYTDLFKPDGTYKLYDEGGGQSNGNVVFLGALRYQMSNKKAEEIIAKGGFVMANTLVGFVTVDLDTGKVSLDVAGDQVYDFYLW